VTVYFGNPGILDLDLIRISGVSVKERPNPIGYFGTGIKFGLAVLLREGCRVTLRRVGFEPLEFTARAELIRGQEVDVVYMGEERLSFATSLGRNWELWQAYRELHSNCLDEGGEITHHREDADADTVIEVDGEDFEAIFHARSAIFIQGEPIARNESLEVYAGPSQFVYYRGVRAGVLPEELAFSYNILTEMTLTEDRTFESQFDMEWKLSTLIPSLDSPEFHDQLLSGRDTWDRKLDFSNSGNRSGSFLAAAKARYSSHPKDSPVRKMVDRDTQTRGDFREASLTAGQEERLVLAMESLKRLGLDPIRPHVQVVTDLGPGKVAQWHAGQRIVFVNAEALGGDLVTLVGHLYEQFLAKGGLSSWAQASHHRDRLAAYALGADLSKPIAGHSSTDF